MITITKAQCEFSAFKVLLTANGKDQTKQNITDLVYCHEDKLICSDG